jgi:hypothetical protein
MPKALTLSSGYLPLKRHGNLQAVSGKVSVSLEPVKNLFISKGKYFL